MFFHRPEESAYAQRRMLALQHRDLLSDGEELQRDITPYHDAKGTGWPLLDKWP